MVHGLETIKRLNEEATKLNRQLPNGVMQTTPTNCFRACVATVLNIPIEDVPEACDGAKWNWIEFQNWLATKGMQAIELTFGNGGTIYPVVEPVLCILTGKSPRECTSGLHAVVGYFIGFEGFQLVHDPHPAQTWIDGDPTHATFFIPLIRSHGDELILKRIASVIHEQA